MWVVEDAPVYEPAAEAGELVSTDLAVELAETQIPEPAAPWSEPLGDQGVSDPYAPASVSVDQAEWLVSPERVLALREPEPTEHAVWQDPGTPASAPAQPLASDTPMLHVATADIEAPQAPESDFQAELERFAAAAGGTVRTGATDAQPHRDAVAQGASVTDADSAPPGDEPGFVRQARQRAFWRSPGVRAALGVLAVLLSVLLVGQWALHERDHLAARNPDVLPLLTRLCEPLGCEVGPVRRIDAVVIDSSTLVRRLGNFYSFDLVLKNTAATPVAVPALELSLTDTRDSVIARRVFLPQELPDAPRLLPARGSLSLSLRLSITEAGAVPMAGYRALVFYP